MQFHDDKKDYTSLTISSAVLRKEICDKAVWLKIVEEVASAMLHVHKVGFLHNDIKMNNVVLDKIEEKDVEYNPVLIDFGKSLPMSGLRGPKTLSKVRQRKYMVEFPHIAPEIVTGKGGQSVQSDIFSYEKLIEGIFLKAKLGPLPDVLNRTSSVDPDRRPTLEEVLNFLTFRTNS
ncbi:hypothetical protein OS493_011485 [Desmophyllum pertusum]|uniref:Protein kinase domain-containing protein n=1 Tax=Desmophyllum pertusum TaxID=174260 RepID=A0A9X0CND4_9CNID|nr:hypothetical protein OS493_011485 [Desmophyllum pertusum]